MKIIIWGTGNYAQRINEHIEYVNSILNEEFYSIEFYVDNNVDKQGKQFNGKNVLSPENILPCHAPIIIGVRNDIFIIKQIQEQIGGEFYTFRDFVYRDILIEKNIEKWVPELGSNNVEVCKLKEIIKRQTASLIRKVILQSVVNIALADNPPILDMNRMCSIEEIIATLCNIFFDRIEKAQEARIKLQLLGKQKKKEEVKTIGIYYTRYANGGAERVISHHLAMFNDGGYKVVLFVDEVSPEEYELPQNVIKIIVNGKRQHDMLCWFKEIFQALKKYNIDVLISHQSFWEGNYYLNCITEFLGCRFIIEIHNIFSSFALSNMSYYRMLYQYADAVVCLSKTDEKFWNMAGVNSVYIPNPVIAPIRKNKIQYALQDRGKTVLWVGRLENKQKNIQDVVNIASIVKKTIPDVRFWIVGKFEDKKLEKQIAAQIEQMNLHETIYFKGYFKDVSEFYEKTDILISTSAYEGFPMTITEAMAFGVPIILYSLPYLELLRHKKGYIEVPQRNVEQMSKEIIGLLNDGRKRKRLSDEGIENILEFKNMDLLGTWEKVILGFEGNSRKTFSEDEKDYINIIRLLMEKYYE